MPEPPPASSSPSVVGWIAAGTLDAQLAAVLWLLIEGGVPVVVAGEPDSGRSALLAALRELAGPGARPPLPSRLPAIVDAGSLEEVRASFAAPPLVASDDELRGLGVVVVIDVVAPGRRRVKAAHYVRPVERDGHGHLQRRPPAVLATWDPVYDTFDDFAWGVLPELAERVGREPAEFERDLTRRAARLAHSAATVH